jgi:transcription termination factor Rho
LGEVESDQEDEQEPPARGRRERRGARSTDEPEPEQEREEIVEGEVEVLSDGSGFVRINPPEDSDGDVYISAAQVRRCELITGDRIAGPRRPPRRSERFASLHRIDTINGSPAAELADRPHFDELPAMFPKEPFEFGSDDPTLQAVERLTPVGKGSRVTVVGADRAGKSELLRRLAAALCDRDDIELLLVLTGVRPEEVSGWPVEPVRAISFAASPEAQDRAVAAVLDHARRVASRGGDAVVLLDTLTGLHPRAQRKALAAARNLRDGGSLTVVATASEALGGETTVIALDAGRTAAAQFPALDLAASGTVRPELLVGEEGAAAIARERSQ